jgi:hypothetical protein
MAFLLPIPNFLSLIQGFKGFRHCSNGVFSLIIRSDICVRLNKVYKLVLFLYLLLQKTHHD